MIELILILNVVLLTLAGVLGRHGYRLYGKIIRRLELKERLCESYLQQVRKEVDNVKGIESDVEMLKNNILGSQLKRGR
jgi:hypothetical protein